MYASRLVGLDTNVQTAWSRSRALVTQILLLALQLLSYQGHAWLMSNNLQECRFRLLRTSGQKDLGLLGNVPRLHGADRRRGFHNDCLLSFSDLIHVY